MSEPSETRQPPEIIFVPPPKKVDRSLLAVLVTFLCLLILCITLSVAASSGFWAPLVAFMVIVGVVAVAAVLLSRSDARRYAKFVESHPECTRHPLAEALSALHRPGCFPARKKTLAVLADSPSDRARIVCFGHFDVPEVGDLYFEPEIITAGEAGRMGLASLAIMLAWFCLWPLSDVSWLPVPFVTFCRFLRPSKWMIAYLVAIAGVLFWRLVARPRYIRMVPGLIDAMEFRFGNRRAAVRSYPMVAGTTVLLYRISKTALSVIVVRGRHNDRFGIAGTQRGELRKERLWQALLSTAPTPKMSDDALLERA